MKMLHNQLKTRPAGASALFDSSLFFIVNEVLCKNNFDDRTNIYSRDNNINNIIVED